MLPRHVESRHPVTLGVHLRQVEDRALSVLRQPDEADGLLLRALLVQVEHYLIDAVRLRYLVFCNPVRPRHDVDVVASPHCPLRPADGGKGRLARCAVMTVTARRRQPVVCRRRRQCRQQQCHYVQPRLHAISVLSLVQRYKTIHNIQHELYPKNYIIVRLPVIFILPSIMSYSPLFCTILLTIYLL